MSTCKVLSAKITPCYLSIHLFQLSRIREFLLTITLSCLNWRNICKLKVSKWSSVITFRIFVVCYYIRTVILYKCNMFTLLSVCGVLENTPFKKIITWYIVWFIMWYILWYIYHMIYHTIYHLYILWYIYHMIYRTIYHVIYLIIYLS